MSGSVWWVSALAGGGKDLTAISEVSCVVGELASVVRAGVLLSTVEAAICSGALLPCAECMSLLSSPETNCVGVRNGYTLAIVTNLVTSAIVVTSYDVDEAAPSNECLVLVLMSEVDGYVANY